MKAVQAFASNGKYNFGCIHPCGPDHFAAAVRLTIQFESEETQRITTLLSDPDARVQISVMKAVIFLAAYGKSRV